MNGSMWQKSCTPLFAISPAFFLSPVQNTHSFFFFFSWQKRKLFLLSDSPLHFAGKPYAPLQHIKSLETWVSDIFFNCFLSFSLFHSLSLSNSFFSSYYFLKVMQSARLPLLWSPSVQLCAVNPNVASKVPIESSGAKRREAFWRAFAFQKL